MDLTRACQLNPGTLEFIADKARVAMKGGFSWYRPHPELARSRFHSTGTPRGFGRTSPGASSVGFARAGARGTRDGGVVAPVGNY